MDYCGYCGRQIIFRHIDGRVVPLHLDGGCLDRTAPSIAKVLEKNCPKCGKSAFYVTHNGGFFWVDTLGPPWPKHPCFPERPGFVALAGRRPRVGIAPAPAVSAPVYVPPEKVPRIVLTHLVAPRPGKSATKKAVNVAQPAYRPKVKNKKQAGRKNTVVPGVATVKNGILVEGYRGSSCCLSLSELGSLPRELISVDYEGRTMELEYIPVIHLLHKVLGPADDGDRHLARETYVVAKGKGVAVFSWAELDPEFTEPHVGVVIRRDGAALAAEWGPYWLAVFGEKVDGRSIRSLESLRIQQA